MHLPLLEIIQMEGYFREPAPRLKIDQSQGLTSGTKIRASFPVPICWQIPTLVVLHNKRNQAKIIKKWLISQSIVLSLSERPVKRG